MNASPFHTQQNSLYLVCMMWCICARVGVFQCGKRCPESALGQYCRHVQHTTFEIQQI